jgi:hypothetical protein
MTLQVSAVPTEQPSPEQMAAQAHGDRKASMVPVQV